MSRALFAAPTSCPPYAVEFNTVQLTILNAKARLCQCIGVVSKQPTKQNSNPKSISSLRILNVPWNERINRGAGSVSCLRTLVEQSYLGLSFAMLLCSDIHAYPQIYRPLATGVESPRSLMWITPLTAKRVDWFTAQHDGIRGELRDLLAHVFSPSRIRCEPMINPAPMRANGTKTHVPCASSSSSFLNADRGDLLVRGLCKKSTDTIIDVHVKNLDSKSYKNLSPKKALERQEKEKKEILQILREPTSPFHTLRGIDWLNVRFWSPSIFQEARKVGCRRMEKPYSTIRGFINARMSIALVRATNRCIRGSRTPASNMSNRFRWEGGEGLRLLKAIIS